MKYSSYISIRFLKAFVLVLLSILLLFTFIDYAVNAKHFVNKGSSLILALHYYAAIFATRLDLFLPLSLCIAGMYTISSLNSSLELTALQIAGISRSRLLFPFVVAGILSSIFFLIHYEYTYPLAAKKVAIFEEDTLKKRKTVSTTKQAGVFHLEDGSSLFYTHQDPITESLKNVYIVTPSGVIFRGDTYFPKTGDLIHATTFSKASDRLRIQEDGIPLLKLNETIPLFSPEKRGKTYFKGQALTKLLEKRNATAAHQMRLFFDSALGYKLAVTAFPLLIVLFLFSWEGAFSRRTETLKAAFKALFSVFSTYVLFLMGKTLSESGSAHPYLFHLTLIVILAAILTRRYTQTV